MPETKFLTLFVPQEAWFQAFFRKKSKELRKQNQSLSGYLTALILTDLQRRDLLSEAQEREIETLESMRPKRISEEQKLRFCLYLPPQVRSWLPALLKDVAPRPGLSTYCWKLFVQANSNRMTAAQLDDWEDYRPGRGTRDSK